MNNNDLISLYKQLEGMEQTKEIKQLQNQVRETLYQHLRANFIEMTNIARVIGYEDLQEEIKKANELIEQMKNNKR